MSKLGVILQIRTGSTRLPGKMTKPFFGGDTIPELMIKRLLTHFSNDQIIIATSSLPGDDLIERMARELTVNCVRGSEANVLSRFTQAIDEFNLDYVIRVCGDNPFLNLEGIIQLEKKMLDSSLDYITFAFPDNTPIMKAHIGLYAEVMKASFLNEIEKQTQLPIYTEHVTNFVYENLKMFNTEYLPLPNVLQPRKDIRLTVDTQEDFDQMQMLYHELDMVGGTQNIINLVEAIDANDGLKKSMLKEIAKNSK